MITESSVERRLKAVGRSRPLRDAALKATGKKMYTGDFSVPEMLYGRILFSSVAHGEIMNIDTSEAQAMSGVKAVITWENTPGIPYNSATRFWNDDFPKNEYVFDRKVRYVGDRVAAVAAVDRKVAAAALKLIKVEYRELPAVFDPEEALKEDSPKIHRMGNRLEEQVFTAGNPEEGFKNSDIIFEDRYETQPVSHAALEKHVVLADYDPAGKLTVRSPSQNTYSHRILLSSIMDMPISRIRMISPALGGGFGGKNEMVVEPVAALLSREAGKPVMLEMTRDEVIVSTRTRHSTVIYIKTGMSCRGEIISQDIRVILNTGAYCTGVPNVTGAMSHRLFSTYKTKHLRFTGIPVHTNIPIAGAMRGYGSPQLFFAHQSQLNRIARELDLDLMEIQRKNLVEPSDLDSLYGNPIGNPRPLDCISLGAEKFGWEEKTHPVIPSDTESGIRRGTGMAIGVHGNGVYGAFRDYTALILKMNEDGTAVLSTSVHDMGNGAVTAQTMIIGEILGLKPDEIACVEADTDSTLWNLGSYASRGVYVGGNAARKVALSVGKQILEHASHILNTGKDFLILEDGFVKSVIDSSLKISISDVVTNVQKEEQLEIVAAETFASQAGAVSYGAHFVEVEVDTKTGKVRLLNYTAVHDVGKAINPMATTGQIEGAVSMGIGYALTEDLGIDDMGRSSNRSFKKYKIMKASEMPEINVILVEEGDEPGPFGAKSIGECSVVPSAPAVANAVSNALGLDFHSIPILPDKILKTLGEGK